MRNKKRSLIALCCVVIMLAETILGVITPTNAKAAESETASSDLKEITFSDFGIDDGTYTTTGKSGTYAGETNLIGTVLCGKVSFEVGNGQSALIYIGGKDDDSSLLLRTYRNEIHMYTEPSDESGYSNYIPKSTPYKFTAQNIMGDKAVDGRFSALDDGKVNFELDLKISFESANVDNDATANDLKLGMWFNGKLYNNEYIYIEDYVDVMGTYLYVVGASHSWGGIITVESIVKESVLSGLTELTFSDFGIEDGTYTTTGKSGTYADATNLIGTVFCGKPSFKVGPNQQAQIYIGGKDAGSSLRLEVWRNAIILYCKNENKIQFNAYKILGIDGDNSTKFPLLEDNETVNFELNLKISFESANVDNEATANDLKLGMWFNGKLYDNEYIYIEDYVDDMGTYLQVVGGNQATGGITTVKSIEKEVKLTEITFKDFGIDDGTYATTGKEGTYVDASNLIGTALCGKVSFEVGDGQSALIYIGGKDKDSSLLLRTYRNEIHMYTEPSVESGYSDYIPKTTPYKFTAQNILGDKAVDGRFSALDDGKVNVKLDLKISFESANVDNDSTANDLKLGMWFNGKLYNNEYIYIEDYVDVMGTYLYVVGASDSWGGIITVESAVEVEEYPLGKAWNTSTIENFPDTEAKAYDIYYWGETNGYLYNEKSIESLTGNECYITYTVDAFSGTENKYSLVGTTLPKEKYPFKLGCGLAYSGDYQGETNSLFEIGYTYFITFKITEDAYEYTALRLKDDKTEILSSQVGKISTTGKIDFQHFGIYLDGEAVNAKLSNVRFWDKNGTDLNVASNSSQTVIFDAGYKRETNESYNLKNGDYVITGTDPIIVTGDHIETGKEYKAGDILDQEGTYKIVSSYGLYTKNVELYMGERKSQNISTQEDVMPISGFYGPYRGTDKYGTYRDHVTDDVFKKIQKMGINLIVASPGVWSKDDSSDTITKSLLLAEKYGLGVYVTDNSLLKKSNVVNNFDFYSNFSSFKGIHIVDEPTTPSYYGNNYESNTLRHYSQLATQLNQYTNLNGYINLFGMNKAWNEQYNAKLPEGETTKTASEYYETYLDEYINAVGGNPSHLSFDHYVFTTDIPDTSTYFESLKVIRKKSLELNIPFWVFVQAGNNFDDSGADLNTENSRPSKGQFLWNVNSALAYGAKGIQYFPMIQPSKFAYENSEDKYDYERNGLIGADGNLTQWGEYVQDANKQITVIDNILMNSSHMAVVGSGRHLESLNGSQEIITDLNTLQLEDVDLASITDSVIEEPWNEVLGKNPNKYGALVGVFEYRNQVAYYVVNDNMQNRQDITLTFDNNHKYRIINHATTMYAEGTQLILKELPAGEAVLVILDEDQQDIVVDLSIYQNGIFNLEEDWIVRGEDNTPIESSYLNQPKMYYYDYAKDGKSYCGNLVIYRKGDVNVDNSTDIRDLVRLKKGIDSENKIVWNSAMQDVTGEKLRKLLVQK